MDMKRAALKASCWHSREWVDIQSGNEKKKGQCQVSLVLLIADVLILINRNQNEATNLICSRKDAQQCCDITEFDHPHKFHMKLFF